MAGRPPVPPLPLSFFPPLPSSSPSSSAPARADLGAWALATGARPPPPAFPAPREKEGTGGEVIELTPVVTLDGLNGEAELSGHPGKEVEGGEGLRLCAQRKSPRVV